MDAALPANTNEHFRVAVTGIVWRFGEKDYEYLITKRAHTKRIHPGKWTVPGGGLHKDDFADMPPTHPGQWYRAAELALMREVSEEVGLVVDTCRYLLDIAAVREDGSLSLILSYHCRYVSGEVSLNEESIDFAWVTASEARAYDLIPGILEELRDVDAHLKSTQALRHDG